MRRPPSLDRSSADDTARGSLDRSSADDTARGSLDRSSADDTARGSLDRSSADDTARGSLDREAVPDPAPEGAGASAMPKPRRARKPADAAPSAVPAAPASASTSSSAEATTEPITLPTIPAVTSGLLAPVLSLPAKSQQGSKSKKAGSASSRANETTRDDVTGAKAGSKTGSKPGAKANSKSDAKTATNTDDPASLSPGAARKQLRAATKARKQYERGEVRRFTWRSRRRRRTWLVAGGAVVALAAFVVVGAYSPLMALRTIEVVGTNRIPAADIQAALSGQIGTPLPIVDGEQVKRELSTFTLIQSYSTESRPPNTLVVRIVERVPVGLLTTPTGFDLVDAAGVVLQSGTERVAGYPVIVATNGVGHPGFTAAAAVVRALPESIRTQLDSVSAATTDDVTLTLNGGERIVWGSAERSEDKAAVLASLMVTYPPGSVGEYDVTSPDSAVLR